MCVYVSELKNIIKNKLISKMENLFRRVLVFKGIHKFYFKINTIGENTISFVTKVQGEKCNGKG